MSRARATPTPATATATATATGVTRRLGRWRWPPEALDAVYQRRVGAGSAEHLYDGRSEP